jgi:hypothetical protein
LARRVEAEAWQKREAEEAAAREVKRSRKIEEAQQEWKEQQEGFTRRGKELQQNFKEQKIDAKVFQEGGTELALVNSAGLARVFFGYLYLYPLKPVPATAGTGPGLWRVDGYMTHRRYAAGLTLDTWYILYRN